MADQTHLLLLLAAHLLLLPSWSLHLRNPRPVVGGDTEELIGITEAHKLRLQKWVNEYNVALFIRVSDLTSVRLIDTNKFACKSVDIHDKSSNWGPQQGTVPIDPFFNKKHGSALPEPTSGMTTDCNYGDYGGISSSDVVAPPCTKVPQENILDVRSDAVHHAAEEEKKIDALGPPSSRLKNNVAAVQLVVTKEMVGKYMMAAEATSLFACVENTCPPDPPDSDGSGPPMLCVVDKREPHVPHTFLRQQKFCLSTSTADGDSYDVYWQSRRPGKDTEGIIYPLYVWGYGGAPVTGDYDLWMVAPHMKNKMTGAMARQDYWWEYMTRLSLYDVRGGIGSHGSMMTPLIRDLLYGDDREKNLNAVLGRDEMPVFHHGAEAQNLYFLQPLDKAVAMVVPDNYDLPSFLKTGQVQRENLATVLASLQAHGCVHVFCCTKKCLHCVYHTQCITLFFPHFPFSFPSFFSYLLCYQVLSSPYIPSFASLIAPFLSLFSLCFVLRLCHFLLLLLYYCFVLPAATS